MSIFIRLYNGQVFLIPYDSMTSVVGLQRYIKQYTGIPITRQFLIFQRREIRESVLSLENSGIKAESLIYCFRTLENTPLPICLHSKNSSTFLSMPQDRIYNNLSFGLNIVGSCQNNTCSLAKSLVQVPCGFGTFQIQRILQNTLCPSCHTPLADTKRQSLHRTVRIITFLCYQCICAYTGSYQDADGEPVSFRSRTIICEKPRALSALEPQRRGYCLEITVKSLKGNWLKLVYT